MTTNTEIERKANTEVAPAGDDFLSVIAQAARDPTVDVAKMEKLLDMRLQIMQKQAEIAFTEAMNRVQNSVPRIVKDRRIIVKGALRSKYAALEDIDKALRPLIIEEGFSIFYTTEDIPPKSTRLILTVKHRLGHKEQFALALPIDASEFRSAVQNVASTVSFGRRILLCLAFNVITLDEDHDGNPPGDFVSEEQALNIVDALKRINVSETDPKFLAFAGADKIEHIQATAYGRIIAHLNKKANERK